MQVIETKNIYFKYPDGFEAIKGVNISLNKGEFIGILGANGCGKTTLFQTFNGLLKPCEGEILIKGQDIKTFKESELYKIVGLVFQNPDDQLFAPTVFEDVSYGVINMGLNPDEINTRIEKALKLLKIYEYRNKPIHSLSFGQKKRVAIAGILVMEPEILILDEPTAGLDPMGVSELMNLIKGIQKRLGISVILSTHDIDLVPIYCDRVYVMDKGKIFIQGTPKQVFSQADLIRSVNLRLPRIGHLMEILKEKDKFDIQDTAITISDARNALNKLKR